MRRSIVVTGGGRGIGRAIVEKLAHDQDTTVVVVDRDTASLAWLAAHPAPRRLVPVVGDAAAPAVADQAADEAQATGTLTGWVNNAAVFEDASLDTTPAPDILDLINRNLAPTIVGCATAVRRFLATGTTGSIVNISSHQAQRPVRGALPYATAKAAIEGLTRAVAVDHGPNGVRANALALGSIHTERHDTLLATQSPDAAASTQHQLAALHPLGRIGTPSEVADVVAYLLSNAATYITGTTLPVDGGRSTLGLDPESHP